MYTSPILYDPQLFPNHPNVIILRAYTPTISTEYGIRRSVLLESCRCCSGISMDVLSTLAVRRSYQAKPRLDHTGDRGLHERVELLVSEDLAVDAIVG